MIVSEYDVREYMLANPDTYTCKIEGKTYVIQVTDSDLRLADSSMIVYDIDNTRIRFKSDVHGITTMVEGEIPVLIVNTIKSKYLEMKLKYESKALLPAAMEMVKHYRETPVHKDSDVRIRLFVLKDVNFAQPGKGHMLINPLYGRSDTDADFLKGYVYVTDQDSIKYETVQAWRYREIKLADLVAGSAVGLDWCAAMSRPFESTGPRAV